MYENIDEWRTFTGTGNGMFLKHILVLMGVQWDKAFRDLRIIPNLELHRLSEYCPLESCMMNEATLVDNDTASLFQTILGHEAKCPRVTVKGSS